jgi:O-antigen ligase
MALRRDPGRIAFGAAGLFASLTLGLLAGVDPKLAILASITCAYILLTVTDLSLGLALFIVLSFLETLSVGGAAVSATKLLGLVLAFSWLALVATRSAPGANLISAHPVASYALALLVGWSALSGVWAENAGDAIAVAYRLLLDAALYVIVYTAVSDRRTARLTMAAFVVGAVAAAGYGLVAAPAVPGSDGRLGSGLLDPNELAAVLVGGVAFSVGLARSWHREPAAAWMAVAAGTFCLAALFLTASRGGLIALGAAMLAGILFGGRWRLLIAMASVVVALAGFFYFSTLAPESARERVTAVTQGEAGEEEGRTTIWKVGWRMFEANPIHGVGSGNFPRAALKYVVQPGEARRSDRLISEPAVAHNSYLEVLSELGLVGGALLVTLIAFSVGAGLSAARRFSRLGDRGMEALSRALIIGMIGILAADFFISEESSKQFWLVLGLGPALLGIAQALDRTGRKSV